MFCTGVKKQTKIKPIAKKNDWIHDIDEEYPAVICAISTDDCSLDEGSRSCREFSYIPKHLQQTVEDTIIDSNNDNESITCSEPPLSTEQDYDDVEDYFKSRLHSAKCSNVRRNYSEFIVNEGGDIKKIISDEKLTELLERD